jgi:hypothetical protein
MKKFYFLFASILSFNLLFANPVITAKQSGSWSNNNVWDKARTPNDGDTIVIPEGKIVSYDDLWAVETLKNVYLKIYGTLQLSGLWSSLSLDDKSTIVLYSGGKLSTSGLFQNITIGTNQVFASFFPPVTGPQIANATSNGFLVFNPLPVKFVGFTVTKGNNDVLVQWATSQENNAYTYEVERSMDANNWTTIAYIAAIGNTSSTSNYSYTDKNVSSKVIYYRIKEVDVDGKASYTSVKTVKTDNVTLASDIKVAAVQNRVLLQFPQQIRGSISVRFISMNGQIVDQQNISNPVGQVVLNSKVTGNYIISISNGQDINSAKQVLL